MARLAKVEVGLAKSLANLNISPQDLSNPVSFQLAFSRIYEALMKSLEEGGRKSYVAEVRFKDSLGNDVVFAVDIGENPPAFMSDTVRVRVIVEFLE